MDIEGPDLNVHTSTLSDQGHHCPFTELLDTVECISGDQRLIEAVWRLVIYVSYVLQDTFCLSFTTL